MAIIKPTFSIAANANTAASNKGPSSWALALNTTTDLTVDQVVQGMETTAVSSDSVDPVQLIDGSTYAENFANAATDGTTNYTAGSTGGFIYMKNTTVATNTTDHILIAIMPASTEVNDGTISFTRDIVAPHSSEAGEAAHNGLALATGDTARTMTLKPQEFAFFPFDYAGDIYVEAKANTPTLEWWIFDRA
tara:strand:+ start:606 stop:1181 length:576 start_codon:yes stop_codon:yes gene_type:complete